MLPPLAKGEDKSVQGRSVVQTLGKSLNVLCRPQVHRSADEIAKAGIIDWKSRPA